MEKIRFFNKPIIDKIKERRSVRTYGSKELPKDIKSKLMDYAKKVEGPFNAKVRLELVDKVDTEKSGGKIGTYGIIKGTNLYIGGVVEKGEKDLEQLGYVLERFILYATSLGLGTCWLGGTFKKGEFGKAVNLKGNELLPIVTPIGYPAEKRGIVESLMRMAAGSNNRKQWNELFFNENLNQPLNEKEGEAYSTALEMVRLAPSASNKQPWRVIKSGDAYNFYLQSAKGYGSALGFNIQRIDMGIAMCHFEMTLMEAGVKGHWDFGKGNKGTVENMEYTATWVED
jgi:nitroreductase